jgi:hypothetical protein
MASVEPWEARAWLARVQTSNDLAAQTVGTAFAVDPRHLVTCAHVVNAAGAVGPGDHVFVDFPLLDTKGTWATVLEEGWRPAPAAEAAQSAGDVALLRLDSDSIAVVPLGIRRRWTYSGLAFSSYGFPLAHPASDVAHGRLGLRVGLEWVRVEADAVALVEPGFSGAPVWADDVGGAVAMVLTRVKGDGRTAFAIPLEIIARTSPIVASALGGAADPLSWLDRIPRALQTEVIPFRRRINERSEGFIGRGFVFSAIDTWVGADSFKAGYIIIRGEPGIGKSAIMAQLARTRGYVHHFNVATDDLRSAQGFLRNVCAQLIVKYGLPFGNLDGASVNTQRLEELLEAAAAGSAATTKAPVVVLVDALDEAETPPARVNRLSLPQTLPAGTYIVTTIRKGVPEHLYATQRAPDIVIDEDTPENKADIEQYVRHYLALHPDEMQDRMREWDTEEQPFVRILADLSEGNFMYLHHVLPDILRRDITREQIRDLTRLPRGLGEYYKRHWEQMKDRDKRRFRRLQEPVLCVLATAREAVPSEYVTKWINDSGDFEPVDVREVDDVFEEWLEFLDTSPGDPPRYRLYHNSFLEFLSKEVGLDRFGRAQAKALQQRVDWDVE